MSEIEKYLHHLPTCNTKQDWTDAFTALAECPDGPDKAFAYEEMRKKQNSCTCGLDTAKEVLYCNCKEGVMRKSDRVCTKCKRPRK